MAPVPDNPISGSAVRFARNQLAALGIHPQTPGPLGEILAWHLASPEVYRHNHDPNYVAGHAAQGAAGAAQHLPGMLGPQPLPAPQAPQPMPAPRSAYAPQAGPSPQPAPQHATTLPAHVSGDAGLGAILAQIFLSAYPGGGHYA